MIQNKIKEVTLVQSLIPMGVLVLLLITSVYLYGSDSSYGGNQIALLLTGSLAAFIGVMNGHRWNDIQKAISNGIANTFSAMLILLMVGGLIGTWIISGTVPAMIYYGLQILNPSYFYVSTCIICGIAALSIGSSWSVAGTIGVGLMGVAEGLGLDPAITAGAIISGSYFGDKMSPLSDTTNLAPAVAGTDLFGHIAHMRWTTIPAIIVAIILYFIIGLSSDVVNNVSENNTTIDLIESHFNIGIHLFIPLVIVFILAIKKFPAFPTLMIGALTGGVFAVIFQPDVVIKFASAQKLPEAIQLLKGIWTALFDGFNIKTGDASMDKLLNRGGMSSMLNTIWLIMCAITFGSILEKLGMLKRLVQGMLSLATTTGSLILVTALTCFGMNVFASDQYIAIVLPGRMFRIEFKNRNLDPRNLSRALEDTGTVTSVLIPWNTCGAFMATTLLVPTFDFALFCFFNLLSPIFSVLYGYLNFTIIPLEEKKEQAV